MTDLPYSLSRSLVIRAPRDVVFRYFTDSERFASWWGKGSSIDARVGGKVVIVYPGGVVARGEVTALQPDHSIAFTYGYEQAHPELPVGQSLVTIALRDAPDGTRLEFRHDFATEKLRASHAPGWRYQLALFANVVTREQHANVATVIDQWFAAWAEQDAGKRRALLEACTTSDVTMQDNYSCLTGRDDLHDHIGMCHIHMPGAGIARLGEPKQCQGAALVEWRATAADGRATGRGHNVVHLAADGRIAAVVGFW